MFVLCSSHGKITSLGLAWSDVLELTVGHRDKLIELLDEVRTKEAQAHRRR